MSKRDHTVAREIYEQYDSAGGSLDLAKKEVVNYYPKYKLEDLIKGYAVMNRFDEKEEYVAALEGLYDALKAIPGLRNDDKIDPDVLFDTALKEFIAIAAQHNDTEIVSYLGDTYPDAQQ